jgi:hypothetical protein
MLPVIFRFDVAGAGVLIIRILEGAPVVRRFDWSEFWWELPDHCMLLHEEMELGCIIFLFNESIESALRGELNLPEDLLEPFCVLSNRMYREIPSDQSLYGRVDEEILWEWIKKHSFLPASVAPHSYIFTKDDRVTITAGIEYPTKIPHSSRKNFQKCFELWVKNYRPVFEVSFPISELQALYDKIQLFYAQLEPYPWEVQEITKQ